MENKKSSKKKVEEVLRELERRKKIKNAETHFAIRGGRSSDDGGMGNIPSCGDFPDGGAGNVASCDDEVCPVPVSGNVASCDDIVCEKPTESADVIGNTSACGDLVCD